MVVFAKSQFNGILTMIWVALMLPVFASCNSVYTTKHFSFPPGSKPHENDWQYTGMVIISSNQRPITEKSKKIIRITIYDKNKKYFLNDEFKVTSASIRANCVWENFEKIQIELLEVGNEYTKDAYNQQLLKTGPKLLFLLTYRYDQKNKVFKRVNLNSESTLSKGQ